MTHDIILQAEELGDKEGFRNFLSHSSCVDYEMRGNVNRFTPFREGLKKSYSAEPLRTKTVQS